jgi:hypothetical protein
MAICKFCHGEMQWGNFDGKWVPLVPVGLDDGLDRAYQDENGALRAAHRLVCTHKYGSVQIVRLPQPVSGSALVGNWSKPDPETGEVHPLPPISPDEVFHGGSDGGPL